MNNRLQEIIKYKTGGRQIDFAAFMGWTPQYVTKLLRGENFGIKPVMAILEKCPEINARWFLLGQGEMLEMGKLFSLQREAFAQVQSILDLERFIPFMLPDELREFEQAVSESRVPVFNAARIACWDKQFNARKEEQDAIFQAAQAQSKKLCKQKTAKKS